MSSILNCLHTRRLGGAVAIVAMAAWLILGGAAHAAPEDIEAVLGTLEGPKSGEAPRMLLTGDGDLRFVAAPDQGHFATGADPAAAPEQVALGFIGDHAAAFGLDDGGTGFRTIENDEVSGRRYVRLQQTFQNVTVFGGQAVVQLDGTGNVVCVLSDVLRAGESAGLDADALTPSVAPEDAQAAALRVKLPKPKDKATLDLATEPQLMVYAPTVVGNHGPARAVWMVQVSSEAPGIREAVLIDAKSGRIALHYPLVHTALSRTVYDSANTAADPGTLTRSEGDAATGIADVDNAYDYFGDTYDFYNTHHGRDSVDDAGMVLSATTRICPYYPDYCPFPNAFWDDGENRMYFGEGYTVDDVIAHELTHGVTDHESQLIYMNESGAINETLSDVWGEFVDLSNGAGTDTAEVRWLLGEDVPDGGAIRDMADPPVFGDPDRRYSPYFYTGASDNGGVHWNCGVGNKLCYLLTDGDTFNGRTITGMGIATVADLFYEMQTNLLTDSSDYADLYVQMTQAAVNLGLTQAQRDNIEQACRAVEIGGLPDPVTGLTISTVEDDPNITLSWTNPAKAFVSTMVRRAEGSYPSGPTDGTLVYDGTGSTVTDGPLTIGTKYYYSVFAYHGLDEFSVDTYSIPQRVRAIAGVPTPEDYFTEAFDLYDWVANDLFDMAYKTITFTPWVSANRYVAHVETASAFPTDTSGSTTLSLTDESYSSIGLTDGKTFPFYGVEYGVIYVCSNGYIALDHPDVARYMGYYEEELAAHFAQPRISALFGDLNPGYQGSGPISWKQLDDRVVVTFQDVLDYWELQPCSFQVEMFFDGRIRITYLNVGITWAMIVGLSIGDDDIPYNYVESNMDGYPAPTDSDGDGIPDDVEGTGDSDGDGTADYLDTDSDDDGIDDVDEGMGDLDDDGIPNFLDDDSDGDGIDDADEGGEDLDHDGTPNFMDDDSDNDGIPDSVEYSSDPLGNDIDGDGIPNYLDRDSDDDGVSDALEYLYGTNPYDENDTAAVPIGSASIFGLAAALAWLGGRRAKKQRPVS